MFYRGKDKSAVFILFSQAREWWWEGALQWLSPHSLSVEDDYGLTQWSGQLFTEGKPWLLCRFTVRISSSVKENAWGWGFCWWGNEMWGPSDKKLYQGHVELLQKVPGLCCLVWINISCFFFSLTDCKMHNLPQLHSINCLM